MPFTPAPRVPFNYFGRGINFCLPDDRVFLEEYEAQSLAYEQEHPEDPFGEKVYEKWVEINKAEKLADTNPKPKEESPNRAIAPSLPVAPTPPLAISLSDLEESDNAQIRLQLHPTILAKLKLHAKQKRKRPRDIIADWVIKYAVTIPE